MKRLFFKFTPQIITGLLVFSFFIPKILQGKVSIPADAILGLYHPWRDSPQEGYAPGKFPTKNPLITDPILQTYPWRYLAIKNIKEGRLPLWNPYSFSGQPLFANFQSAPFSIFNLFFLAFPFNIAWSIQIIAPPILIAIFMFLFLKNLKYSDISSTFGAFVLPFSGFFIAWMTWGTIVTTAVWLPLILLSVVKLFEGRYRLWFLILVFSISQTIFSGHPQTALYVVLTSFFFIGYLTYRTKSTKNLILACSALIFGLLISAVQLIPSLEFVRLSARGADQGYFVGRKDWFLPLENMIQLIAPDFFGNPATYNYWGTWNYAEFVSFIGIVPLVLVLLSFFRRNSQFLFFAILCFLSLFFAIGNPLSKIPYILDLPFISSMQPSRIIFIFVFSLSVLAAHGLEYFISTKPKRSLFLPGFFILFVLVIIITFSLFFGDNFPKVDEINSAGVALRNLILPLATVFAFLIIVILKVANFKKSIFLLAIFALTLFELFRFGFKFTSFSKLSWIFPSTGTTEYLSGLRKPFRILITDRRIFNGNSASIYSLETVQGYDPLFLEDYAQFVTAWESGKVTKAGSFNRIVTPQNFDSPLTDLLNVKYIVTFDELPSGGFTKIFEEGDTKIFKNNNAFERAFFVEKVTKVEDRDEELGNLIDRSFDTKKEAVSSEFEIEGRKTAGQVNFISYSDQMFKLKTSLDSQAPLIVSNVHYPGWQAFVDGTGVPIRKVNFMFQSVMVPEGNHEVEFRFKPRSFYNGLYFLALGVVLTIAFSFYLWRREYQ